MSDLTFEPGDVVRFTTDRVGLLANPGDSKFAEPVTGTGATGVYDQPHELEGWHMVTVELEDGTYWAPVHVSMIEPVLDASGRTERYR